MVYYLSFLKEKNNKLIEFIFTYELIINPGMLQKRFLVNSIKLLEILQQMFIEMNKIINEIRTDYAMLSTLMDPDDTYTMKVNVLLLSSSDSR